VNTGLRQFDAAERLAETVIKEARERKERGEEPQTGTLIVEAIRAAAKDIVDAFPLSGISDLVAKKYGIPWREKSR